MGLKPWEFWRLTHAEFLDLIEGHKARIDQELERFAWHAANVMNVHLKKKVTVKKLLGKEKKPQTREQKLLELEKLKAAVKKIEGADT